MNRIVKTYTGSRTPCGPVVNIHYPNRSPKSDLGNVTALSAAPSIKLINHSPNGFEWGYSGSGPAQLAIGLLLDVGVEERTAIALHQKFKSRFISSFGDDWQLSDQQIMEWVASVTNGEMDLFHDVEQPERQTNDCIST